jgi:hypothetical protein
MSVASGMDRPAPEVGTMHASSMEAAAPKAATSTTASECIIGNQSRGNKNSCG